MTELLAGVRRRLRLAWGVATGQWLAPAVAVVALGLVVAGRLRPWAWPEPAAVGVAVAAVVALVVAALAVKVPPLVAARAADRGLATGDAFATALELESRPPPGPFGERIRARAAELAAGRKPAEAVPVRVERRRMAFVAGLTVAALGLGLTANHQDEVRRRQQAEQDVLDAEADKLAGAAEELREGSPPSPNQEALAARLEELARELATAPDLARGQEAIDAAARELAGQLSPDLLAQKAAVRGLDRSLASSPLPGASAGDAAAQLREAASALAQLTPEQRAELAERLAALAATQAAGNTDAASALSSAAASLAAGDLVAAASALGAAADAQATAAGSVAGQEATLGALASIAAARAALAAPAAGPGQGSPGQGQGQGSPGQGQGSPGQGRGAGQGQGAGLGQGAGQGQGGASGQVGGTNARTGSGVGGPGVAGGGTGNNPSGGLETATVFDPAGGTEGEVLNTAGQQGDGPSRTVGQGDGLTLQNAAHVPLGRVLPRYSAQATAALDRLDIPPSQRALVQAYFAALAAGQ